MGSKSGRKRRITKNLILSVMEGADKAFLTTGELVGKLPASRQAVNPRLEELMEEGKVEGRKASNVWFYWLPGRVADSPDDVAAPGEIVVSLDDLSQARLEERANEKETTPGDLASELVREGLEEPPLRLWEEIKLAGVGFSIVFLAYTFIQQMVGGVVGKAALYITIFAMSLFFVLLIVSIISPVVDPFVDRLRSGRQGD